MALLKTLRALAATILILPVLASENTPKSRGPMDNHSSVSEFDASPRDEVLELLVERIARLTSTPKKVLAMYYYENLQPAEIAACLGLSEHDIDLIRAQTVRLLQTNLFRDLAQSKSLDWTPLDTFGSRSPHPWLDG